MFCLMVNHQTSRFLFRWNRNLQRLEQFCRITMMLPLPCFIQKPPCSPISVKSVHGASTGQIMNCKKEYTQLGSKKQQKNVLLLKKGKIITTKNLAVYSSSTNLNVTFRLLKARGGPARLLLELFRSRKAPDK